MSPFEIACQLLGLTVTEKVTRTPLPVIDREEPSALSCDSCETAFGPFVIRRDWSGEPVLILCTSCKETHDAPPEEPTDAARAA